MGRPVVLSDLGRPVTVSLNGIGEPLTIEDNGYGEPVKVVNAWGQPVVIEDGDALALGADLLAWWDASYGITVTGAGVSSWVDRKSSYELVQATDGARPAYSATGFNGVPGLTFDGTNDSLAMASQPFPADDGNLEIWAVVQNDALFADAGNRFAVHIFGASGFFAFIRTASNAFRAWAAGTNLATAAGPFESRHVVRAICKTGQISISVDGAAAVTFACDPAIGVTGVYVGSNQIGTSTWHGKMRDVIVTGLLSAEQATYLQTFLLARRAL